MSIRFPINMLPDESRYDSLKSGFSRFLLGGLAMIFIQCALYFRSTPFGPPYVLDVFHYLPAAIAYGWWGLLLCSLLPLLLCLSEVALLRRSGNVLLSITAVLYPMIDHLDHEIQRFVGMHLTYDFLLTYAGLQAAPDAVFSALHDDAGGAYSACYLVLIPPLLFLTGRKYLSRLVTRICKNKKVSKGIVVLVLILLIVPCWTWNFTGSKMRKEKVKPPPILLIDSIRDGFVSTGEPVDYPRLVDLVRRWWSGSDPFDLHWQFVDDRYPMLKRKKEGRSVGLDRSPNIVLVILETFRAWDMRLSNPAAPAGITPRLESLAHSEYGAYWPRFYAGGAPSASSFMVIQSGIPPHSRKLFITNFTKTTVRVVPEFLRQQGYSTYFATGSDPDWDNQRYWARKWYDRIDYHPEDREIDRLVFDRAGERLRNLGRTNKPFYAVIASITNHIPFRNRDPQYPRAGSTRTIFEKLHHTMGYTDKVVGEFIERLRPETWFDRTIFLFTGDHGYDLGDRGVSEGVENLRHETSWVPLIVYGKASPFRSGGQSGIASHLDLAPTILDLAGVSVENSFFGHSLLDSEIPTRRSLTINMGNVAMEEDDFGCFFPVDAPPMLFSAQDLLQKVDIAADHPDRVARFKENADALVRLVDYLISADRLYPSTQ